MTNRSSSGLGSGASDAEGAAAVRHVRQRLESALAPRPGAADSPAPEALPASFESRGGVFVTLRTAEDGELRGCVGFPRAALPVRVGLGDAALAAATEDPRFPPVGAGELPELTIEVSLLSAPERLGGRTPEDRLKEVRVGVDGLIVEADGTSGLLLPQVAVEQRWGAREFLEATCTKAGLRTDRWRSPEATIYRFQSAVFAEERPGGPVRRVLG
ncbi:MAG: TIGR00296 family protein [Thermoplasmata archaeon]|nr:TIGR00296 family protein [Thermoplasmata archaeon]MCI4338587.1 TIGR00296 family protein [Thermoplasmata archaeon]MCI4340840.1 TIGR00296 family protein [Thermoplasmata archaeon]